MQMSSQKRKRIPLIPLILLAVLVLLAGAAALAYTQQWWPFATQESSIVDGVDYGPPTEEEVQNSQNAKKDILEEDETTQDGSGDSTSESGNENSTTLKTVSIGISYADVLEDNVEVRAFVIGVIEGTGTCTATLTRPGSQPVVKSSKAFIDASTSQCEPILIPLSTFDQSGEWALVVSYKSPTSTGESEKTIINIR